MNKDLAIKIKTNLKNVDNRINLTENWAKLVASGMHVPQLCNSPGQTTYSIQVLFLQDKIAQSMLEPGGRFGGVMGFFVFSKKLLIGYFRLC